MKKTIILILTAFSLTFAFSKKVGMNSNEKEALRYMYEEEKLAKDVYSKLAQMYPNLKVFQSIVRAESVHEKSVENVMHHYNLPTPPKGAPGVYANSHIQNLYNELIKKAKKSPKDALEVGIMVEVTDVEDLDRYLKHATSPDVKALFKFLRAGSYNHYNAFNWSLKNLTGKDACELMSSQWCQNYPFQRGVGRAYRNWYWFAGGAGSGGGMMRKMPY